MYKQIKPCLPVLGVLIILQEKAAEEWREGTVCRVLSIARYCGYSVSNSQNSTRSTQFKILFSILKIFDIQARDAELLHSSIDDSFKLLVKKP